MEPQPPTERAYRPLAFDKMEGLVREMQDTENGVPVRSQKGFLTSIPSAFMGYDLIGWLMDRLKVEEPGEGVHIANQVCQYGYFFPVSDSKNLIVKDDSSLYRFQTPYYWPWQHRSPDNVEYSIYLCKRTMRNKQRHALEEYEMEALASLKKNLQNKWDFITMQAEEQVRLSKERKKDEKIVSDSQERAYWRVHRPPPGFTTSLEPIPVRSRGGTNSRKRRNSNDIRREIEFLRGCLNRTRVKVSQALENLAVHCDTYMEYDPFLSGAQPSNPWLTEDPAFWQFNNPIVETPTEKRVRRWALSMEDLVSDQTGLQEFTNYLRKEYSHENIRFWTAVNDLRHSSQSQIPAKVQQIYEEFLAPGAPCEINIDGKTMERTQAEMKNPTRFTFDAAAEHVYTLLLKKDCYPRFVRSEHYKNLLASGVQPSTKKRFFGFGGAGKKKTSTNTSPAVPGGSAVAGVGGVVAGTAAGTGQAMTRRRGSDRSLTGSAHELSVTGVRVGHSHSQSNLTDIPYRDPPGDDKDDVCPWDSAASPLEKNKSLTEDSISRKNSIHLDSCSSSSDVSLAVVTEVSERLKKTCNLQERLGRRTSSCGKSDSARPSVSSAEDIPEEVARKKSFCTGPSEEMQRKISICTGMSGDESTPTRKRSACGVDESIRRKSISLAKSDEQGRQKSVRAGITEEVGMASNRKKSVCTGYLTEDAARKKSVSASSSMDESLRKKSICGRMAPVISVSAACVEEVNEEAGTDKPNDTDICPWEDEESCKVDAPYVKTYATLGYL